MNILKAWQRISVKQKYRKLKKYPTLRCDRGLQRIILEINNKKIFSGIEYSNLYPKGSNPAWLYGTPKIRKTFLPGFPPHLRLIFFLIDTYHYNLVHSLGSLLLTHKPSKYSIKYFLRLLKKSNW